MSNVPELNFKGAVLAVAVPALRCKTAVGDVFPMPTLPLFKICSLSAEPIFKIISPAPLASLSPVTMASEVLATLPAEPGMLDVLMEVPSAKINAPPEPELILISPLTSSGELGLAVPMPTLPALVSTYSWLVLTAKSPVVERLTLRLEPAVGVMPKAPEAVMMEGVDMDVTKIGEVAKTKAPDPVSFVTAEIKLADEGVARNVATLVPSPLTPVLIGSPVALVKVAEVGVPKTGVIKVGEVAKTNTPVPVSSLTAPDTAAESPVEVNTFKASVKTNLEAVRAELVRLPVMVVAPVKVEAPLTEKVAADKSVAWLELSMRVRF